MLFSKRPSPLSCENEIKINSFLQEENRFKLFHTSTPRSQWVIPLESSSLVCESNSNPYITNVIAIEQGTREVFKVVFYTRFYDYFSNKKSLTPAKSCVVDVLIENLDFCSGFVHEIGYHDTSVSFIKNSVVDITSYVDYNDSETETRQCLVLDIIKFSLSKNPKYKARPNSRQNKLTIVYLYDIVNKNKIYFVVGENA